MIAHRPSCRPRSLAPLLALLLVAACTEGDARPDAPPATADVPAPGAPEPAAPEPAARSGSAPAPGRWAGVVTGGFKGDSILFTVAPAGGEVTDVEFRGHWRCASSTSSFKSTQRMDVGNVPGSFPVGAEGEFGDEKKEPYLLWTVAGRFIGADSASGTIRIEYDTECDTYELAWSAAPAGR